MLRKPYLKIAGADGADIVVRLGRELVSVRLTDLDGGERDECAIIIRRQKPYLSPPPKYAPFTVSVGYDPVGAIVTGTYLFENVQYSGDPEQGEQMTLVCLAPMGVENALSYMDSEQFDQETGHLTFGDVFKTVAGRAGLSLSMDKRLAELPLPGGYILRWKQSAIGFLADIGEDLGAIVKPQAGFLAVRKRGSLVSPSGKPLEQIRVPFDPHYVYDADLDPQWDYSGASAEWFDSGRGRAWSAIRAFGGKATRFATMHVLGSEALAEAAIDATMQRMKATSATAMFQLPGVPHAVAGAQVVPDGFGPGIDNVTWEAERVLHEIVPDRGWTTTVDAISVCKTSNLLTPVRGWQVSVAL